MITVDGKEAEVEVTQLMIEGARVDVYVGGYWLADFACFKDATTFVHTIEVEGRDYETFATNKLRVK